jgi:hypothetical protein
VRVAIGKAFLLGALLGSSAAIAGGKVDDLLSRNPVGEAERAFSQGDKRHIVVPVCDGQNGEVLPGWPLYESPEALEAIEKGRRPVTCADMGPDSGSRVFIRVAAYAERYNRRLLELNAQNRK